MVDSDVRLVLLYIRTYAGAMRRLDWSRLIPRAKVDRYETAGGGIELTWRVGPGLSIGLGKIDLWLGWPRHRENCALAGCGHSFDN